MMQTNKKKKFFKFFIVFFYLHVESAFVELGHRVVRLEVGHLLIHLHNQSINQSDILINQSINQSIISINQSINQIY